MKHSINLKELLSGASNKNQQVISFSLICLGIIESLISGTISASNAVELFFHANNCLFVRNTFIEKGADKLMSHGTQLNDIFDALPREQAQQHLEIRFY
ncbi:MAG: hypothetical protein H7A23_24055 [Leptospiraceae bacterium]|nr:hypothetical protein [Leptospiraceae bacterium]